MFKPRFEPDNKTEAAKATIRSIIDQRILADNQWAVSLVRKDGTEHAFLILEGVYMTQHVAFRSDLFLDSKEGSSTEITPTIVGNVFDRLIGVSEVSRGEAFIRVNKITHENLTKLSERSDYQSWPLTHEEADKLLKALEKWGNETLTYHIAGDSPIFSSSTSTSKHHNCVSWCEAVLKEVNPEKFALGKKWHLIKRPSERVDAAISMNN